MTHPLQTKVWANFRREWGNDVEWVGKNLIVFSKVPFTNFTVGTCLKSSTLAGFNPVLYQKIGKKHKTIFIKFEPNILNNQKVIRQLKNWHFVLGRRLFTPTTFQIDLIRSEEELLKSFHHKTRYNIRLAERQGVTIKEDNSDKAFEKYLKLTFETAKRQGFYAHTENYHRLMWKHLRTPDTQNSRYPIAHLLTATYKKEVITTWILFVWKDFLYYPYGASSDKYKEVMANNLMMWEAIKFGKKLGLKTFDLWGREEGKGFTKFKEGYSPKVVEFIGTWDLVINKPLYYLYRIAESIRWFILRLK